MTLPTRVIVIFPPAADVAVIDPLRQRFDPLASVIAPHITLVFPFQSEISTARGFT